MVEKEFRTLLEEKLVSSPYNEEIYKKILTEEIAEIAGKDEINYFLDLVKQKKIYENEHNLLVPYLLGICKEYNAKDGYSFDFGDWPDIDTDFTPKIRDILKKEYAPKAFGEDKVCDICTYTKFGIRSALIDMARVLGLDRKEILNITTNLKVKDDEGETLTWDKAIELYDDLRLYLEKHPDLAEAAHKLLGRIRGIGVHASGLIISSVTIKDFVPLIMPKQDGKPASAWVEGLSGSDLGAVGLVKFDLLGLDAQLKVGQACHYAKQLFQECRKEYLATGKLPKNQFFRKNIDKENLTINALPNSSDWSDLAYLDDPKSLAIANRGDLRMIFQFDGSPGIRSLAREGGVTRFDDLPAYASLYRPGPIKANAHKIYCQLNKGEKQPDYHPLLEDILGPTMGLLIYQEQIMKLLHKVGKIPLKDCETIRKAISKKQVDKFKKYREQFIENGMKFLDKPREYLEKMFEEISFFSGYGFNKSIDQETIITSVGQNKPIKDFIPGDRVYCVNENGEVVETEVVNLHDHGVLSGYEVTFSDEYKIICTLDHKFLTEEGQKPLKEIIERDLSVFCDDAETRPNKYLFPKEMYTIHFSRNDAWYFPSVNIKKVMPVGNRRMYDLEVANRTHNFILPNGVITSNSHAVCYSYNSARQLFLKSHVPEAYVPAYLDSFYPTGQDNYDQMKEYLNDGRKFGLKISRPDLNESRSYFRYANETMYYAFNKIKGIGEETAKTIENGQPYSGLEDFLLRFGTDKKVVQALIALGMFGPNRDAQWEFYEKFKIRSKKKDEDKKRFCASEEKFNSELKRITGHDHNLQLSSESLEYVHSQYPEEHQFYSKIRKMTKRFIRVCNNQKKNREQVEERLVLTRSDYVFKDVHMTELLKLPMEESEKEFLGFNWENPVQLVGGFEQTFEELELSRGMTGPVEVLIEKLEQRKSAKGTVFYSSTLVDALDTKKYVTIWENDYKVFSDELVAGNIVRIWLQKPDPGSVFKNFTMKSQPRWKKVERSLDQRVHVLKWRQTQDPKTL